MMSDLRFFFFLIPIWRWLVNYLHDLFTVQCMCCHTGLSMPLSKGMPSVLLQLTAQTLPQMLPLLVWRAWQKKNQHHARPKWALATVILCTWVASTPCSIHCSKFHIPS